MSNYKPDWEIKEIPFTEFLKNCKPVPFVWVDGNGNELEQHLILAGSDGTIYNADTKHVLKPYSKDAAGHMEVKIKAGDHYKHIAVHILVATAWLPNPENKKYVHHINGIAHDNRLINLVWVTFDEHTYLHKLMRKGNKEEYMKEVERLRG